MHNYKKFSVIRLQEHTANYSMLRANKYYDIFWMCACKKKKKKKLMFPHFPAPFHQTQRHVIMVLVDIPDHMINSVHPSCLLWKATDRKASQCFITFSFVTAHKDFIEYFTKARRLEKNC